MANIPKKVLERLQKGTVKFQKVLAIAKDRDVNESDTVAIISDMLCDIFGYDKYLELTSEFSIRGTYCDLAVKLDDKVEYLIEAKAIGMSLKENHLRQAVGYGANHGIQWVILTNGIEWHVHRIRFEQPIDSDLVSDINFMDINSRSQKDLENLWMISKEGVVKNAHDEYFQQKQNVNGFIVSALIQQEQFLNNIRRELRKLAPDCKVDISDISDLLKNEVLKRNVLEGEEAKKAFSQVKRFYNKIAKKAKSKESPKSEKIEKPVEQLEKEITE